MLNNIYKIVFIIIVVTSICFVSSAPLKAEETKQCQPLSEQALNMFIPEKIEFNQQNFSSQCFQNILLIPFCDQDNINYKLLPCPAECSTDHCALIHDVNQDNRYGKTEILGLIELRLQGEISQKALSDAINYWKNQ